MATGRFDSVWSRGDGCAIPHKSVDLTYPLSQLEDLEKVIQDTGIKKSRLAVKLCPSDPCFAAAGNLRVQLRKARPPAGIRPRFLRGECGC